MSSTAQGLCQFTSRPARIERSHGQLSPCTTLLNVENMKFPKFSKQKTGKSEIGKDFESLKFVKKIKF
jgi:hypothetical protein